MKVLITSSTLPASDSDPVPSFVKDQALWLLKKHPDLEIIMHAPHNAYSETGKIDFQQHLPYREIRFHYFWPFRLELLSGRGIMPSLKSNPALYLQIPFLVFFQFASLWKLVRAERPDLLYAHWFTPQAITCALVSKLTGVPFLFTTHASDVSVLTKIPLMKHLVYHVCRQASAFTAVSRRTAEKLENCFTPELWREKFSSKLSIIPMGVDVTIEPPDSITLKKLRTSLSLDKRPIILFLGRLADKKGVNILINSFADLPKSTRNSVQLVIAGDGQQKAKLKKLASTLQLDNVHFTGYVHGQTKNGLIALSTFVCLPSIIDSSGDSEGLPVVLLEALAFGKIIIASDATGAESILEHGKSGYIFPNNTSRALTEQLQHCVNVPHEKLNLIGSKAQILASTYHWDTVAEAHYQLMTDSTNFPT